jgi:hypothetical protein
MTQGLEQQIHTTGSPGRYRRIKRYLAGSLAAMTLFGAGALCKSAVSNYEALESRVNAPAIVSYCKGLIPSRPSPYVALGTGAAGLAAGFYAGRRRSRKLREGEGRNDWSAKFSSDLADLVERHNSGRSTRIYDWLPDRPAVVYALNLARDRGMQLRRFCYDALRQSEADYIVNEYRHSKKTVNQIISEFKEKYNMGMSYGSFYKVLDNHGGVVRRRIKKVPSQPYQPYLLAPSLQASSPKNNSSASHSAPTK